MNKDLIISIALCCFLNPFAAYSATQEADRILMTDLPVIMAKVKPGGWEFASGDSAHNYYFVNLPRITRVGDNLYQAWELISYATEGYTELKHPYRSAKVLGVYDCQLHREKFLTLNYYEDDIGNGAITETINTEGTSWEYAVPGSVQELTEAFICKNPPKKGE